MPLVPHTPAAEAEAHAAQIVALDAGDLAGPDLDRAAALLATCAGCAALRDDLVAIRGAMTALPAPARRRDYRLTDDDAARLRPSGWRRVTGWLAAPRSSVRPLATGLASLGVVGLLLTAGLPGLGAGSATLLSSVGDSIGGAEAAPYAEESSRLLAASPVAPGAQPVPAEQPAAGMAGEASPATRATTDDANQADPMLAERAAADAAAADGGPSAPLVVSLVLLVAGLGLFLARAIALRRTA